MYPRINESCCFFNVLLSRFTGWKQEDILSPENCVVHLHKLIFFVSPHLNLEVICCWLFSTDVSSIGEVISTIPSRVGWVQFFYISKPDCDFYLLLQISQRYRVSFMPADMFSVCISGNTLFVLSYSLGR